MNKTTKHCGCRTLVQFARVRVNFLQRGKHSTTLVTLHHRGLKSSNLLEGYIHENLRRRTFLSPQGAFAPRPRRSPARRRQQALYHGVLLQSSVGPPTGVPETLSEEPL